MIPASFACPCGFRDEVMQPAPDAVYCPECKKVDAAVRFIPLNPPPHGAGRELTDRERRRIEGGPSGLPSAPARPAQTAGLFSPPEKLL